MQPIVPMEPQSKSQIPQGENWIAQVKWDGVRVLTYFDGDHVRLFNRKLRERTLHYPEITDISSYCDANSVILDGEIIALGEGGKPSFHEVMRRDGISRMDRVDQMQKVVPITYMIFDVLYWNGKWITDMPLTDRNQLLLTAIQPTPNIQLVESHNNGNALFEVIKQYGMEGIVMKKTDSTYRIGEKSDIWVKIKNYQDLIAVVGGFTLGNNNIVNAVLLGLYDEKGQLTYIGHTGTAKMSQADWKSLTDRLRSMVVPVNPFINKVEREKEAYWVRPELTAKIQYAEWTPGRSLRQPSIQAFVEVPPEECVFDLKHGDSSSGGNYVEHE